MFFHDILHDKYLRVVFGLGLAVFTAALFHLFFGLDRTASIFLLHFSGEDGIRITGGRLQILSIPLTGIVIFCINLFLADFLYKRERFLAFLLGFMTLALSILLFIAVSVIVSVN